MRFPLFEQKNHRLFDDFGFKMINIVLKVIVLIVFKNFAVSFLLG